MTSRLPTFLTLLDLFAWINLINSSFQNYVLLHNMLSKLAREEEDVPPRKKAKSGLGSAAEWKIQLKIS